MAAAGYLNGVNISMVLYIIMCILVGYYGGRYFFTKGDTISGVIFLIGIITIFIIYGKRWFDPNGMYNTGTITWPPVINTCPDFLTAYTVQTSGGSVAGCIDTIGVSRTGAFQKVPPSGIPTQSVTAPYTTNNNGVLNATMIDFFPINVANESPQALCDRLANNGLTWDGVFDGDNCLSTQQSS
jgi:hypothetical protein